MFGPLGSLVGLAADALFDTVSQLSVPVAEEVWRTRARDTRAVTDSAALQEIAEHLGAIRALLEDVRNTQQHYVAALTPNTVGHKSVPYDPDRISGGTPHVGLRLPDPTK